MASISSGELVALIHDIGLVEWLANRPTTTFAGEAFRVTPMSLDPLAPSTRGGRWAQPGESAVLYTSLGRECALAEVAFHWGQLTPYPSKPASLHRLRITAHRTLRLIQTEIAELGVSSLSYHTANYKRTQEIGAAVSFLGCDGLIIPSARWNGENLVLMMDNHNLADELQIMDSELIDWHAWALDHEMLEEPV